MNINQFMEQGISTLVKTAGRYYLKNPKGLLFLTKMARAIKKSANIRMKQEESGTHIPPVIIASITSGCNLNCSGCYSRAFGECGDKADADMSPVEWKKIMLEAASLGVSFFLMAGGEPMMRKDILMQAATVKNMVFPIFTNGTMMDRESVQLFDEHRNLIPVFSLEGNREATDDRRGGGTYQTVQNAMTTLSERTVLFGVSITVTKQNMHDITTVDFVEQLRKSGCGLVFFVEYVPAHPGTEDLVLDENGIQEMQQLVDVLRQQFLDMIVVSFPGDEEKMGGCLASGRGFFHINANGGAEPCPFSPYSTRNLRTSSMKEVLQSGFFKSTKDIAALGGSGGCTLFDRKEQVEQLLK